jgi:hypothetical protein
MLSRDLRVHGYSAASWLRLLDLFGFGSRTRARERASSAEQATDGTLVIIDEADETPCAAFHTRRGPIAPDGYQRRSYLPALC